MREEEVHVIAEDAGKSAPCPGPCPFPCPCLSPAPGRPDTCGINITLLCGVLFATRAYQAYWPTVLSIIIRAKCLAQGLADSALLYPKITPRPGLCFLLSFLDSWECLLPGPTTQEASQVCFSRVGKGGCKGPCIASTLGGLLEEATSMFQGSGD